MARILKGASVPLPHITKGLGEQFFETAEEYSNNVFQIDAQSEATETWAQVKTRSVRLAIYLKSIGIKPKDVVMLGFPNNMDNVIPALAAIFLGAYVSSFDLRQDATDIKYEVSYIEPKVIVVDHNIIEKLEEVILGISNKPPIIVAGSTIAVKPYINMKEICDNSATRQNENDFKPYPSDVNDIAFIFFSSGTTSMPKGICLSHQSLLLSAFLPFLSSTITLIQPTSLYWISAGLIFTMVIKSGCKAIVGSNIPVERMLHLIEKYQVPVYFCAFMQVSDILSMNEDLILKFDLTKLRFLALFGSAFSPTQLRTLRRLFPHTKVVAGYGCTETAGGVTTLWNNEDTILEQKIKSAGKLIPNVKMKIVDSESRELLPPNEEGEILVKTPKGMSGYYKIKNTDAFDNEGFLKTGDLGYYDEDEHIYVTDRLNSTFKYQAYKISPIIIETLLKEHGSVEEAIVIGIPHERDRYQPAACVVLKRGTSATPEELKEFVDSRVPDYYKLRGGLKIIQEFPLTPSGKIQRKRIKQIFLNSSDKKYYDRSKI